MTMQLSELKDGELATGQEAELFEALRRDGDLRDRWQAYHLAGDALRKEAHCATDITAAVMDALKDEPVVLAPRARKPDSWQHTALAMAATVAGVAVVAWVALGPQGSSVPLPALARAERVAPQPVVAQASSEMQDYVVAHQAQTGGLRFRGGADNIRTVAVGGAGSAR